MCSEIHVNDFGTSLRATIKDEDDAVIDISDAASIIFILEKPNLTTITASGAFVSDGTDGKVQYITQSGIIDTMGQWRLQVFLDFPDGEFRTNIYNFKVYKNL